ncbi:hypothetical protein [Nocardia altamirensis]|uniref:hypothetical protein n=1 Tax=Nocardia altamirensis TaxID=472158 RepID=UPI0008408272|nr:hypothetical protein [Nocardia altamirensis]
MLDMDDPSEVLAAASRFTGAIGAANGQVARVAQALTPREHPGSAIDDALVDRAAWVRATFERALAVSGARAAAVYRRALVTVRALEDADAVGGVRIAGSESN